MPARAEAPTFSVRQKEFHPELRTLEGTEICDWNGVRQGALVGYREITLALSGGEGYALPHVH